MSRAFWVAVGAIGGVVAYRKGTEAAARARELGPLGTAQVAAQMTSRLASRTAHGLGRLNDIKARRDGRLVIGSAEEVQPIERPGSLAELIEEDPQGAPAAGRRGSGSPAGRGTGSAPPRPTPAPSAAAGGTPRG